MVIVILGVLSAQALPRFVNLKNESVVAATQGLASALATTSSNFRLKCATTPSCDNTINTGTLTLDGNTYMMHFGWLDAGDNLGVNQIDTAITSTGFSAAIMDSATVRWTHQSTSGTNCYVEYREAPNSTTPAVITTVVNDC